MSSNLKQISVPKLLSIPDYKGFRYKPRSIAAGLYCSYILMDDRRLFRSGKVGTETLKAPTKFKFVKKFFNGRMDDFTPLKVMCKWSKLMTVTYVLFVDFRKCNISKTVREKFVEKINNTWVDNNSQLLPTHDDLMAKHIWYKYLQKPGKHYPPNLGFSGKSRIKTNNENQWLSNEYKTGDSKKTIDVAKSFGYIETGIDWKNKKMKSEESEEEIMNSRINYIGDSEQLENIVNGKRKITKKGKKKRKKSKKSSKKNDNMIIIDEKEYNFMAPKSKNRSPFRKNNKSKNSFTEIKSGNKSPSIRSPRFSKNSSRYMSPSLIRGGNKFSGRFKSPSSPDQDIKINHENGSIKKSNLKKGNSKYSKSNREVTFDQERGNRVLNSKEMMKDIIRLRKKKHSISFI